MSVTIGDVLDRHFRLVTVKELNEPFRGDAVDRPSEDFFYQFTRRIGWGGNVIREEGQIKVDHAFDVIATGITPESEVLALCKAYLPGTFQIHANVIQTAFNKELLSDRWFRQNFRFGADALWCVMVQRPRFYMINPVHAHAVLPAKDSAIAC